MIVPYLHVSSVDCPIGLQAPSIDNILECSLDDKCLGIQCCVNLDFKIDVLMFKTWVILDPCEFTFSVGFEKLSMNVSLFSYEWGKMESIAISDFFTIR